jgi:hypothetical protein
LDDKLRERHDDKSDNSIYQGVFRTAKFIAIASGSDVFHARNDDHDHRKHTGQDTNDVDYKFDNAAEVATTRSATIGLTAYRATDFTFRGG